MHEAGYVPSNSEKYPLGGIISAVQNAFHATPEITCSQGSVEELRLCFYKDFKVWIVLLLYYKFSIIKFVYLKQQFYIPFIGPLHHEELRTFVIQVLPWASLHITFLCWLLLLSPIDTVFFARLPPNTWVVHLIPSFLNNLR